MTSDESHAEVAPLLRGAGSRSETEGSCRPVVSAITRRAVLARLLPRLAFRSISSIEGNFLTVRGKIRSYKIHLGSGNILMSPNDQYLCIVPDRGSTKGTPNLPFEGDGTLAVIISKALLLMNDDKITGPTIVSQIRR